jgi:hypothetical protein
VYDRIEADMPTKRFGIDEGNESVKFTDGNRVRQFVHALRALPKSEIQTLDTFSGSSAYPPDYLIVHENKRAKGGVVYVTGDSALNGFKEYETGARRYRRGYYDVLALRALTDLYKDEEFRKPDNSIEIVMVCTHAPQDNMHAGRLSDSILGWHHVTRAGHTYHYNVVDVQTVDEPVAGLFNYTLAPDGKPYRKADLWSREGKVLVVDIGGYTTDFQEADQRGIPMVGGTSFTIGIKRAKDLFRTLMRQKYPDWLPNADYLGDEQIEAAFRNREGTKHIYQGGTRSVDCTEEVQAAIAPLMNEFLSQYRNRYANGERHSTILLTGGGCGLLNLILRDAMKHPNVVMADSIKTIQFANVKGAYKLLNMMARKGIA